MLLGRLLVKPRPFNDYCSVEERKEEEEYKTIISEQENDFKNEGLRSWGGERWSKIMQTHK